MRQLRHDLNYGISAGLLIAAIVAIISGIIAHLWDLNDFIYHTYSGYVMTLLVLAHVWLNWKRMVNYVRHRFRQSVGRVPHMRPLPAHELPGSLVQRPGSMMLSRRGFLGLTVGSVSGYLVGRGLRPPPAIPGGADLGVVYHQWSKPGVIDALGTVANWGRQPPLYKSYPDAAAIILPAPDAEGGLLTEEAISRRRSTRDYSGQPMALDELSRVLLYSAGINADRWGHQVRTAPSSGALYPLEIYAVVHNVAGLSSGLYHYRVQDHRLEQMYPADLRSDVVRQGLMQAFLGECNVVLVLTVIFQRMRWKYQDRTYRYGLIEAGHVGQNVYLAATSIGLGACAVGAFMDDEINAMLGVDGTEEVAIYMLALGKT